MAALSADMSDSCRQQLLMRARDLSAAIDDARGRRDAMLEPLASAAGAAPGGFEEQQSVAESAALMLARLRMSNQVILTLALRAPVTDASHLLGQLFDQQA